jgi:hypothetical protein
VIVRSPAVRRGQPHDHGGVRISGPGPGSALDLVALDRRIIAQTEVRDRLAETIRAATGGRVRPAA